MSDTVIQARALGKSYVVNNTQHWAIRNINFDVQRGDVLGVIGRNGAGKTTLLRVLSRITDPTEGQARIKGRIGTLLETGTGFHPDLTGRENIYMNGAILGMKEKEIASRMEEIVEFSGIGKFVHARVKTYSSGMRSRLTFAVAAHLDTDILFVDEVLAVGDIAFQEKCLKKMDNLTQDEARTILFVSHSMGAVQSLCNKAILIENSQVYRSGETATVIREYHNLMLGKTGKAQFQDTSGRRGSGVIRLVDMQMEDLDGNLIDTVPAGTGCRFNFSYVNIATKPVNNLSLNIVIYGSKGSRLLAMRSEVIKAELETETSKGQFVCTVPMLPLLPGHYDVQASCLIGGDLSDKIVNLCHVVVSDNDYYGTGRLPSSGNSGDVIVDFDWVCE